MATLMLEGGGRALHPGDARPREPPDDADLDPYSSIQKLKAIHDATHPGAKLRHTAHPPAAPAAADERAELLSALVAEVAAGEGE
jgi:hypothetical protein